MSNAPPSPGVRPPRWMRALRWLGLLALCASAADALWFAGAEKSAHYFWGHWFDAVWTVQIPLLLFGVAAIAASFLLRRAGR